MSNILEILLRAKGADQVKSETGKANKSTSETSELFSKLGKMLTVGVVAKGFSDIIKAYAAQEVATTKLNAALKAQGVYSENLSKRLQDQASALQSVTTFGDEAITQGQAFALSLGMTADVVEKITPTVLDFAAAVGVDLQTAFRIMGQASAGETGLLKRYGIIVDESKLKSEGFNAVLSTMQKNFSGMAEELAKSGMGPMKQFGNTIGDIKERLGAALIPAINDLLESLKDWLPTVEKIGLGIMAVVSTAIEGFANMAQIVSNITKGKFKEAYESSVQHGKNIENIWKKTTERMLDAEKEANKESIKLTELTEEDKSLIIEQKIEKAIELEKKRYEEALKEQEKAIATEKEGIEDVYRLKQELRQMDLEDVIASVESEIAKAEEGSERRKALELALADYRKALNIESAARIAEIQDSITSNLEGNITDMILAEKSLGEGIEGIWKNMTRTVIELIVRQVVEEKAAGAIRIGIEKAIAASKVISAHAGIPFVGIALGVAAVAAVLSEINRHSTFQSGGTVPGAEGEPRMAMVHGGERIVTPQEQRRGMGGGVTIGKIEIQFPNVTTFSDWMNASPALVKRVTETKILQALSTLETEGKVKEGTVLV